MTDIATPQLKPDPNGLRLWWLWIVPGITRLNCFAFFWAAFATIGLLVFVTIGTNYVLNTNFDIPVDDYGTINGDLAFWTEVTQILLFSAVGIMADRIGRRPVYAFGLVGMGIGYFLYPFADSLFELTVYRIIYAAGLAGSTGMLGTIVADYPQEVSRGKMVATVGVMNGLGVVLVSALFSRVPTIFVAQGLDEATAGRYTHWIIVFFCLLTALVVRFGLNSGTPVRKEERPGLRELVRAGFEQARNPRISLAYASAFVARSDLVVLGTFTVTWGNIAGVSAGLGDAEAAFRGTMIFVIAQTAALLWSPVIGLLLDYVNRVTGVAICMALAAIGYSCTWFVDDPLSAAAVPYFLLLGVGQISAFFGATTIIGQEAPQAERGAVVGMFNVMGAVGILISTTIGGRLFDAVAPAAPFVFIGIINACIFVAALVIRQRSPGHIPEAIGLKIQKLRRR